MTYSRWRAAMSVSGLSVAIAIAFIIVALATGDNGLLIIMFIYVLVPSLLTATVLCFFRPTVMWEVVTIGKSAETGGEVKENYGPFNSGHAARKFARKWDYRYEGFAVVEYREISKTKNS